MILLRYTIAAAALIMLSLQGLRLANRITASHLFIKGAFKATTILLAEKKQRVHFFALGHGFISGRRTVSKLKIRSLSKAGSFSFTIGGINEPKR